MKKQEFFSFILNGIVNLSIDQKVKFLHKVQNVWIPEILSLETKNYFYCNNCKRYIKKSDLIVERKRVINKGECVFRDAGYGEDDEYGDVTYLITYRTCPKCKSKEVTSKTHIKTENVHSRYGDN